jgi:hypothetical protein
LACWKDQPRLRSGSGSGILERAKEVIDYPMELLGIALSVPVAFVASMLYCFLLDRLVLKFEGPRRWLLFTSYFVLVVFAAELVMLLSLGTVRSGEILGGTFYVVHLTLFFLGVPSLANVLLLRKRRRFVDRWYVAGVLCTVFAFFLVLLQYSVSESLYGIE